MRRRTPTLALALLVAAAIGTSATPTGAGAAPASVDASASVDAFVASDRADLLKSPDDAMVRVGVHSGGNGLQYFAYERLYRGLPVIGGDFVVVTGPDGTVRNTSVAQQQVIAVDTTAKVSADAAFGIARGQLSKIEMATTPRLVVLAWDTPRLAWEVKLTGTKADGAPSVPSVYVDAMTGAVAGTIDLVKDGTGNSFYNGTVTIQTSGSGTSWSMQDSTRPGIRCGGQNGATFTGTDDVWGNASGTNLETACVDALYAVQQEWNMLSQWLGRNGINGSGGGFPARVGLNQANAFWNGSLTNFGRNSASTQQAVSQDVVAHEYGHAIFQTTPGGAGGGNENGGINEGTGDIFGALTEHFTNNPNDTPDFLVGEEVNLSGSGEIRNMFNPAAEGDPNCWSTQIPNTEVHAAAGPLNHWFYLLARGSNPAGGPTSPTCNGSAVTGVGVQSAGRIYYNAMLMKTSTWRYANVRLASITAAANLFGANSTQCAATKAAWNAVSVPVQAGEPGCAGGPPPGTTVYSDTFETATGWTTNPNGTDTAATGQWVRGDPAGTTSGGTTLQLGTTVSGTNDLVTGAAAGTSAGDFDVDGGVTSIQSPTIALPATGTLTLNFSWYLAHLNNATSADFFRVSVVVGTTATTVFTQAGAAANRAGAWATGSANLTSFAGQTIRLRVEAADAATGSLIEAGVDNVTIVQS